MFSPREKKILKVLGRRKMTIVEITDIFYDRRQWPLSANNGVGSAVRSINRKCAYHKLDWFLNGMGLGRAGRTIWREKR